MRIVIALGGNALLRRGQALSAENQLTNIQVAALQIAKVAQDHEVLLTHGNGPQVGLLALQSLAYKDVAPYPLDLLGAQTQGMIAYLLERELRNLMPSRALVSMVTLVEVSMNDAAFSSPSKPIGPIYNEEQSQRMAQEHAWTMAADGKGFRRVVASPAPVKVFELASLQLLLANGVFVIAAGGGGIPVAAVTESTVYRGIEAVIDKDATSSLLAQALNADCLIIASDVDAVYLNFGTPEQRAVSHASPVMLSNVQFATGSMAPKIAAVCSFVSATNKRAVIGSLDHIEAMLHGERGTQITADFSSHDSVQSDNASLAYPIEQT